MATTVLLEDFESIADWTSSGTWSTRTGRTGIGVGAVGTTATLTYTIPAVSESDVVVLGFAWKITTVGGPFSIAQLRSDSAATPHLTITLDSTSGSISVKRGTQSTGTVLVQSSAGAIVANTWTYVEVRAKLHDTAGEISLRLNGVEIASATNVDTRNGGTKTTIDSVRITAPSSGVTNYYDDLYIVTGSDAAFLGVQRVGGVVNDVLHEPFDDLDAWTASGTGTSTIVAGRTGNAVELTTALRILTLSIPVAQRSYYVIVGFAVNPSGPLSTVDFLKLFIGTTLKAFVRCSSTGVLNVQGSIAPTPAGAIVAGEWNYVEVRLLVNASGACAATIRVNDVVTGGPVENGNLSVVAPFEIDTLTICGIGSTDTTTRYDDLYVLTGTLADFEGDQAIGGGGGATTVKIWNGSAYVDAPVTVYDGSGFVDAESVKIWDGGAFV